MICTGRRRADSPDSQSPELHLRSKESHRALAGRPFILWRVRRQGGRRAEYLAQPELRAHVSVHDLDIRCVVVVVLVPNQLRLLYFGADTSRRPLLAAVTTLSLPPATRTRAREGRAYGGGRETTLRPNGRSCEPWEGAIGARGVTSRHPRGACAPGF